MQADKGRVTGTFYNLYVESFCHNLPSSVGVCVFVCGHAWVGVIICIAMFLNQTTFYQTSGAWDKYLRYLVIGSIKLIPVVPYVQLGIVTEQL